MGNLISIAAHCRRGEEMIVGDNNHIFLYEGAGASGNANLIFGLLMIL